MKKGRFVPLVLFVSTCVVGVLILAFSSYTATECTAEVKSGEGTVEYPLQIEVIGNAGILPFIDSLLPFRGIPSIELSYSGERFYVPGANTFFMDKQPLAVLAYVCLLVLCGVLLILLVLRLFGKRVTITSVR